MVCSVHRLVHGFDVFLSSCLNLLQEHTKRDELLDVLLEAGESAWARGAHEVSRLPIQLFLCKLFQLAIQAFESARPLLGRNTWVEKPGRTLNLLVRLSAYVIQSCF